jgi:hypothetical protein
MQSVLDCFHDWLDAGAGGAANWSLEPENHEGWRVSIDEGASPFTAMHASSVGHEGVGVSQCLLQHSTSTSAAGGAPSV